MPKEGLKNPGGGGEKCSGHNLPIVGIDLTDLPKLCVGAMTPFCPSGTTSLLLTKIKQMVQTSIENSNSRPIDSNFFESQLNRLHKGVIY